MRRDCRAVAPGRTAGADGRGHPRAATSTPQGDGAG